MLLPVFSPDMSPSGADIFYFRKECDQINPDPVTERILCIPWLRIPISQTKDGEEAEEQTAWSLLDISHCPSRSALHASPPHSVPRPAWVDYRDRHTCLLPSGWLGQQAAPARYPRQGESELEVCIFLPTPLCWTPLAKLQPSLKKATTSLRPLSAHTHSPWVPVRLRPIGAVSSARYCFYCWFP